MTRTKEDGSNRFLLLDGLRLCAALMVVAYHYLGRNHSHWGTSVPELFPFASKYAAYGALGVQLFFIISGFVILMSAEGRSLGQFVASRLSRLFPAYWVAVMATAAMMTWLSRPDEFRDFSISDVLINLTMTQSAFGVASVDGVYWTLWVELLFYVLVAILIWRGITESRVLALAFIWPLIGAISMKADGILDDLLIPKYSPFFAAGMVIYLIYRNGHSLLRWLVLTFTIAASTTQGVTYWVLANMSKDTGRELSPTVGALILILFFAIVLTVTLTPIAHRGPSWLSFAGALTYPLYLIHENWGWWTINRLHPLLGKWPTVGVTLVLVGIAAALIVKFVEEPLRPRLRKGIGGFFARSGATGAIRQ